jgi:hypothetical protein
MVVIKIKKEAQINFLLGKSIRSDLPVAIHIRGLRGPFSGGR